MSGSNTTLGHCQATTCCAALVVGRDLRDRLRAAGRVSTVTFDATGARPLRLIPWRPSKPSRDFRYQLGNCQQPLILPAVSHQLRTKRKSILV